MVENVIIMGAAGRDFHNFNVYFRDNQRCAVVGFTATQTQWIFSAGLASFALSMLYAGRWQAVASHVSGYEERQDRIHSGAA